MSELTLLLLRITFLIILWAFVFAIVYSVRSDLLGQRVRRMPQPARAAAASPMVVPLAAATAVPVAAPRNVERTGSRDARRLVITSGAKSGLEIDLPEEQLTIGRSSESALVIRDDYTSTHHARLLLWADGWVIQDLDSTNGTYLDGVRVIVPTQVPLNTVIKIGTTSFELRR
ncbi:MAG: FHA domain-containing protein [Salinibacterium sp.]|nr:FHA domain-containing protein [Salinibacterium sp.]